MNDDPAPLTPHTHIRLLFGLAWLNVLLHAIGLALAAFFMRPGTPAADLPERLAYLASGPLGWTLGWVTWMSCAVALIAFLAGVSWRLGEKARLAQLGLIVAVVGAAFDLLCDSIYILVFPALATSIPSPAVLFVTVERVTAITSLVIANGAYSVGILLVTLALNVTQGMPRITIAVGYAVAGCGFLLAGSGFTGVPWHTELATGPTIGLFCLWVVLVARALEPRRRVH